MKWDFDNTVLTLVIGTLFQQVEECEHGIIKYGKIQTRMQSFN